MEGKLRTLQEVQDEFLRKEISIRSWAIANNLAPAVVHGVLKGRFTGRFGQAHKAAVKLGLKDGEIVEGGDHV
jgi:gp16 family phage-associated protein